MFNYKEGRKEEVEGGWEEGKESQSDMQIPNTNSNSSGRRLDPRPLTSSTSLPNGGPEALCDY